MKKSNFILTIILFVTSLTYGQKTDSISNLTNGKWAVFYSSTRLDKPKCDKTVYDYQFYSNGTYKQFQEIVDRGVKKSYYAGVWKLENNKLTVDENDFKHRIAPPIIYNLNWLDKDHFYSEIKETGSDIATYVYFCRK